MSKINLQNDLPFVLGQDKILYQGKTTPYKAPFTIAIFLITIIVLSLDMVFLGVGFVGAVFKELKWLAVVLFIVKIIVDIFIFVTCYFVVKDRVDRAKYTKLFITETKVVIALKYNKEISFISLNKTETTFSIKRGLLHRFCGVFALKILAEDFAKTYYFITEDELEKIKVSFI